MKSSRDDFRPVEDQEFRPRSDITPRVPEVARVHSPRVSEPWWHLDDWVKSDPPICRCCGLKHV